MTERASLLHPGPVGPAPSGPTGGDGPEAAPLFPHLLPIETPRLRLVPPQPRHVGAYQTFIASDRAVARGWDWMPHEAWRSFAVVLGHHLLRGFGPYVLESREDGRTIGLCGPWWPEGQAEREIKWSIWNDADEGKGYAFEAARALLTHAFTTLGWPTAVSYIAPDNLRSATLARRLGATEDGSWTTPRGSTFAVFRHPRIAP